MQRELFDITIIGGGIVGMATAYKIQRNRPDLCESDIRTGRSGVRAFLLNKEGDTRTDFRMAYGEDSIHVLNAPSPAATAALSIGDAVWKMADKKFAL